MQNLPNKTAAFGAFSLALAIALGAFAAHGMKSMVVNGMIDEKYLQTFHTGVLYQMVNSLGLILISLFHLNTKKLYVYSIYFISIGMLIFCFSLYVLSFNQILGAGFKYAGAITPIGGLLIIIGWCTFGTSMLNKSKVE